MTAARKITPQHVSRAEARVLQLHWKGAIKAGGTLPMFEDIVLGGLGRMADRLMLVGDPASPDARILQAGRATTDWIGWDVGGTRLADFPPDCIAPMRLAIGEALRSHQPVTSVAYRVRNGVVESYELLLLPTACRWGPPMVVVYVHACGSRYDLVEGIFKATGDGILALAAIRDPSGVPRDLQIVAFNEAAARMLGVDREKLLWRNFSTVEVGFDGTKAFGRLLKASQTGEPDSFELTLPETCGASHLKVSISPVNDLLSVTLTDVAELKRREASMKLLFDSNPMPMWLYDPVSLKFLAVNDAAIANYGYTREEFEAKTLHDIWPRDEWELQADIARNVHDVHESERSLRHIKRNGVELEVLTYARRLTFGGRPAILVAVVDVTERRQAEARIAHMAHHDALTGLPNRVRFQERLDEILAGLKESGKKAAVLYLDLDRFKFVNDSLGHPVGDQLLKAVAGRLREAARSSDTVARLGGDEFAVVLSNVSGPEEVGRIAGKLVDSLSERYRIQDHDVVSGVSIGIVMAPDDGSTHEILLRNADLGLYRAKAEGRGRYHFFEAEMERRAKLRRSLELDLRKAFEYGEFELYYQPLVNTATQGVSGCEALLRWRHPERGMIAPSDFIPLAEEIGLIVPLGEWVLRQACADAVRWPDATKVAVNLSPVQFRTKGLLNAVVSALAHAGLPAHRLELEITESVLLAETTANLTTLHQLRDLGVRISLDDFGTGYSSLSYLRTFPFDKIKIDQSFVRELAERPDSMAIVRAVTGLGASLGVATTAEGVETEEQLAHLRGEGCTEVQGYLLSPPKPARDIAEFLQAQAPITAKVA